MLLIKENMLQLILDTLIDISVRENAVFSYSCVILTGIDITAMESVENVVTCLKLLPKYTPPRSVADNVVVFKAMIRLLQGKNSNKFFLSL